MAHAKFAKAAKRAGGMRERGRKGARPKITRPTVRNTEGTEEGGTEGFWRWSLSEGCPRSENTLQPLFRCPRQGKPGCRRSEAPPGNLRVSFLRIPPRTRRSASLPGESATGRASARPCGGKRLRIYKNISNAASRTRMAWRGLESTLKNMKTASRTRKSGRKADGLSGRGRPARGAFGWRKTSEKANVFCNLASSGAAASRTSRSHALPVQ